MEFYPTGWIRFKGRYPHREFEQVFLRHFKAVKRLDLPGTGGEGYAVLTFQDEEHNIIIKPRDGQTLADYVLEPIPASCRLVGDRVLAPGESILDLPVEEIGLSVEAQQYLQGRAIRRLRQLPIETMPIVRFLQKARGPIRFEIFGVIQREVGRLGLGGVA